jgi:hypothetical protein
MVVPAAAQARVDGSNWPGVGKARSIDTPSVLVAGKRHDRFVRPAGEPARRLRPDDAGRRHDRGGQPVQAASEPNGFHWRDGLVGALAALGLALLAFAALLGTQRRRAATA